MTEPSVAPSQAPSAPRSQRTTHPASPPLVVKLGGSAGMDVEAVLRDLAAHDGPWILVHGGNAELDELTRRLGHEPRFVTSASGHTSRVTDLGTIGLIQMSYRGRINNDLVLRLQRLGVAAVGLSGLDGGLLRAERKEAIRIVENGRKMMLRDDYTGKVTSVNVDLLRLLLDHGYRPVVTIPALASDGSAVNVDGDRAAAAVAAAMGAKDLLMLSNVPGLLRDVADPSSVIPSIARSELAGDTYAQGRMKKKLLGAEEALAGGVQRVVLGAAMGEAPIRAALAGTGTVIA